MGLSVSIVISGNDEELTKLSKLKDSLGDFRSALKTIGDQMVRYYSSESFASQGGVFGSAWEALSPIYAKRKGKLYPGRGILVATGNMQNSFTAESDNNSLLVTNTAEYAVYHQSTEQRSKMPYRPFMAVNDEIKGIVQQAMQDDIDEKLRGL